MRKAGRAWTGVALLVMCGCSHSAHPPSPQPTAAVKAPAASSSPARSQRAAATPSVAPAPSGSASPAASPSPILQHPTAVLPPPKRVPRLAPNAAPQILDVGLSETKVHPGDRVFGRVVTTSNVASVEARIGGYAVSLAKVGVGRFELTYTVGPLPWFVHGNFTMQVIARNTRGDTATRDVPLTVR